MTVLFIILTAVEAYLLGSISASILITRNLYRDDVRNHGSGNAGATNVARVFGMKMGVVTLFVDMAKTAVAILLSRLLAGSVGAAIAGVFCLIGHCWPIFFGFKGGKGVSIGAMVGLMFDWRLFLVLVVVFFVTFAITRTVSKCSIAAAFVFPIAQAILGYDTVVLLIAGIFIGALVIFNHRANISRMIAGVEPKFVPKKKD